MESVQVFLCISQTNGNCFLLPSPYSLQAYNFTPHYMTILWNHWRIVTIVLVGGVPVFSQVYAAVQARILPSFRFPSLKEYLFCHWSWNDFLKKVRVWYILEQNHFVVCHGDVIHTVYIAGVVWVRIGRARDDPSGEVEHTPTGCNREQGNMQRTMSPHRMEK